MQKVQRKRFLHGRFHTHVEFQKQRTQLLRFQNAGGQPWLKQIKIQKKVTAKIAVRLYQVVRQSAISAAPKKAKGNSSLQETGCAVFTVRQ